MGVTFTHDLTKCVAESKCHFVVDLVVLLRKFPQEHSHVILHIYYTIYKMFLVISVEFHLVLFHFVQHCLFSKYCIEFIEW